ncbi:MAG TPA: hypothetical protein DGF30_03915 [Desulfomicrobium sp.]|nr:hypothetical protein [Desulfomicrobium sp.]
MRRAVNGRGVLKAFLVMSVLIIVFVISFALIFHRGGEHVSAFCSRVSSGITLVELAAMAEEEGVELKLPGHRREDGMFLVRAHSRASFGRHTCLVVHDGERVVGAQFEVAD